MAVETVRKTKPTGLGLEGIGDLSSLLSQPDANVEKFAVPLELSLDLIDEDPNQPRTKANPGFSSASLEELADTIRLRGVKTPISVRVHDNGRYIFYHGARRYRASKLAGKFTIPAYVDNDYTEADQVIENLQRNELTSREIAEFIGREIARGKKKSEIAKEIGKSPSFVTQHVTLLDLPDAIARAVNAGRVNDVTVINELVTANKSSPEDVASWLSDPSQDITRGSVKLLREFLEDKRNHGNDDEDSDPSEGNQQPDEDEQVPAKKRDTNHDPDKLKKAIIQVRHDNRPARLILNRRPQADGWGWLKYEDDGFEFETALDQVQIISILEG